MVYIKNLLQIKDCFTNIKEFFKVMKMFYTPEVQNKLAIPNKRFFLQYLLFWGLLILKGINLTAIELHIHMLGVCSRIPHFHRVFPIRQSYMI